MKGVKVYTDEHALKLSDLEKKNTNLNKDVLKLKFIEKE